MNEMEAKEPVEFEDKKIEVKVTPKRVKIDKDECDRSRIGTIIRDVPFTDYSVDPPEELVFEAMMTPVAMSERKSLIKRCTTYDRAGIPEIDWEKLDDLVMARTYGLSDAEWDKFKNTHPLGLYNKLALAAKEVNGELTLTKDQIDELKNLGGQEQ